MHEPAAIPAGEISIQLLTISDTRRADDDKSGILMKEFIDSSPFRLAGYEILREDFAAMKNSFSTFLENPEINVIITSGGTGLTKRDQTVAVLETLLEKKLPGFGEIFRSLSYEEIGPRAILSGALAGKVNDTLVFALPGSPAAVKLAFEKIILNVLHHGVDMTLK